MIYQAGKYYKVKREFEAPDGHAVGKSDFIYCVAYDWDKSVTFADFYGTFTISADLAFVCVDGDSEEEPDKLPLEQQVGGDHYKSFGIQPFEFIERNNLSFAQGNVIKYICRYKSKGGLEDLKKARHYIDMIMQMEYGTNL